MDLADADGNVGAVVGNPFEVGHHIGKDKTKLSRIQLHLDDLVTQMGEQLYGGCIAAEPLVTGRSPCRWCDYGFICCHEDGIGERALDAPAKPFEPEEKKEEDQ